jgi:hypothetical protein
MLRVGQKIVCIDGAPVRNDCAEVMPLRLVEGQIYTVRELHTEPHIHGYGVRLVELPNPSIVWSDGTEKEWSYQSERFRPIVEGETEAGMRDRAPVNS